jgi:hypothetical protein
MENLTKKLTASNGKVTSEKQTRKNRKKWSNLSCYPGICPEGLRETMTDFRIGCLLVDNLR